MSEDFDPFDTEPGELTPEQLADRADNDKQEARENGLAGVLLGKAADVAEEVEIVSHGMTVGDPATAAALDEILGAVEAPDDAEPPEPDAVPLGEGVEELAGTITFYRGELPADIAAVWATSPASELNARTLIEAWGLDGFRNSNMHKAAVAEYARDVGKRSARTDFRTEKAKKK